VQTQDADMRRFYQVDWVARSEISWASQQASAVNLFRVKRVAVVRESGAS
jgi:hypothetical protein